MEISEIIVAFVSGVGAVLSSLYALRKVRERADHDCQQRIDEIRDALHEGYRMKRDDE